MPRRGRFTGFEGSLELDGAESPDFPVCFSGGLPVLAGGMLCLGLLLLGFVAAPEFAGFSFGLEVRNAPRTSSS
jgi:hypothetical protein